MTIHVPHRKRAWLQTNNRLVHGLTTCIYKGNFRLKNHESYHYRFVFKRIGVVPK